MDFLGNVNVFKGRIEAGQAVLGGVSVAVPGMGHESAPTANMYVRPHELDIERHRNGKASLEALIARINPAGSFAKIALRVEDGSEIQVDLPFERLTELELKTGEQVYVAPRKVRVFVPEYSI